MVTRRKAQRLTNHRSCARYTNQTHTVSDTLAVSLVVSASPAIVSSGRRRSQVVATSSEVAAYSRDEAKGSYHRPGS